jgi:NADH pyrophosphatase NudC (nudix superfamily)
VKKECNVQRGVKLEAWMLKEEICGGTGSQIGNELLSNATHNNHIRFDLYFKPAPCSISTADKVDTAQLALS